MTLAAEAPDLDMFGYLKDPIFGWTHHRGFTHSFLGLFLVSGLVVGFMYLVWRIRGRKTKNPKLPPRWGMLFVLAYVAGLSHILLDFTNNYGVRPFWPFSEKWYSWDIVFIIDPFMLAALFLGLALPGLLALITEEIESRKPQFRGRGTAILALLCVAAVILVRDFEHRRAVNALNSRTYGNQEPLRASAFPQFLSPLAWNGVVETQDFFHMLPVDSGSGEIDPLNKAVVRFKPEETPVTLAAKRSRLGRVYLDWAAYPIVSVERLEGGRYQVQFEDLRFETVDGVTQHRRPPLTGHVVLDPQLRVEEMYTGGPPKANQ